MEKELCFLNKTKLITKYPKPLLVNSKKNRFRREILGKTQFLYKIKLT